MCNASSVARGVAPWAIAIAGSPACFERTRQLVAAPAGLRTINWSNAAIAWTTTGASLPVCKDDQAQRMTDGTVRAHRAAWRAIVEANRSAVVLEEDAELLGSENDVQEAVRRCLDLDCDVQYLGMTGDFFTSHAYYLSPRAAARLLANTQARCNRRKADYAIRLACLGTAVDLCLRSRDRLRDKRSTCNYAEIVADRRRKEAMAALPKLETCLRPPRLLWRRGLESVGIFAQDHLGITSYSQLERVHAIPGLDNSLFNRSLGVANAEAREALTSLRERQCKRKLCMRGVNAFCAR